MTRIEIVHERWTEQGGSENVVRALAEEWPQSLVRVAFSDPGAVPPELRDRLVPTGLGLLYRASGRPSHAPFLPLAPAAMRRLRPDAVDAVDAVVISHHAVALAAARGYAERGVPAVAYVHSPARWAWNSDLRVGESTGVPGRLALRALAAQVRAVETGALPHLSAVVTNSTAVAERLRRWWGIEAAIVPPPVDVDRFTPGDRAGGGDYFLAAGRLVPYRRVDIAIRAAQRAGVRLIVAGSGRDEKALRAVAGPETTFLGRVSDEAMVGLQRGAIATLMPGEEDFGIVPVEAMATGTPVIARAVGGALDTVLPGVTGTLVGGDRSGDAALVEEFADAMRALRPGDFDPAVLRRHAEGFATGLFRERMRRVVDDVIGDGRTVRAPFDPRAPW